MSRHLAACEKRQAAIKRESQDTKAKKGKLFHLQVEGTYAPMYWMHIEMPASATLAQLDTFLRDIWLECCGHLSQFKIGAQHYSVSPMAEYGDRSMRFPLEKMLKPGMIFSIEPTLIVPDVPGGGGVRLEEEVLITDTGSEVLTKAPYDDRLLD